MKITTNPYARRGFTLVELLVVIVIIAALAGLTGPMVMRQQRKAATMEATGNARQLYLGLFGFDTEYGSYPDNDTADSVRRDSETQLNLSGNTSNDYFRQLIASGHVKSEEPFYAKTANSPSKPDNDYSSSSSALAPGEVGFGYIMDGDYAFNSAGDPSRPIAVAPLLNNSSSGEFDPDPYDGMSVVLKLDGSVTQVKILPTSKQINIGNTKLLETGTNTVWGTNTNPRLIPPASRGNRN
jgi:prepilin-type N-terminal cleavage/methylation domain-containing protein